MASRWRWTPAAASNHQFRCAAALEVRRETGGDRGSQRLGPGLADEDRQRLYPYDAGVAGRAGFRRGHAAAPRRHQPDPRDARGLQSEPIHSAGSVSDGGAGRLDGAVVMGSAAGGRPECATDGG